MLRGRQQVKECGQHSAGVGGVKRQHSMATAFLMDLKSYSSFFLLTSFSLLGLGDRTTATPAVTLGLSEGHPAGRALGGEEERTVEAGICPEGTVV